MSVKLLNRKNRGDNIPLSFGNAADSKIYFDGTNTYWEPQAVGTGKLMIALGDSPPAPDADFHIWNGSAGSVNAISSASLVIEDSANAVINLLAPLNGEAGLWIGNSDSAVRGRLIYYGRSATLADSWEFQMVGSARLKYSVGAFAFQEATTISTSASALTLNPTDNVVVTQGKELLLGHTASKGVRDAWGNTPTPALQVFGEENAVISIVGNNSGNARGPSLVFVKSDSSSLGSVTSVNGPNGGETGDHLGGISWIGADGSHYYSQAAMINAYVDGTPGSNDMPGRLVFFTTTTGVAAAERWRITSVGSLTSLAAAPANAATTDGGIIATGGIAFTDVANAWIDDATHGSGTVTHYIGNQTITTSSDMRVKSDITAWDGDALSILDKARLVEFNYDIPGGGPQDSGYGPNARGRYVGMLAQETIEWAPWVINAGAGKDCPECVTGASCDDHSPWGVEYQHLIPLMIKGIQDLHTENKNLRALIATRS